MSGGELGGEVANAQEVEAGPQRPVLDPNDPSTRLRRGVIAALKALPGEFQFKHTIGGVNATDLFNLNTFLGSNIELEVVRTLNALRTIWDSKGDWADYAFERSSQAFPDVRLVNRGTSGPPIALGIELKGWWMLAKEGVPSLRFEVDAKACTDWDLVCCVPWYLSSAVSGHAVASEPWVESAKYAARWRDYWWTNIRRTETDSSLIFPDRAEPYPTKADRVTVKPAVDAGGNFGRLPRCRPLLDDFVALTMRVPILGIEAGAWRLFLRSHTESRGASAVIEELQSKLEKIDKTVAPDQADRILAQLRALADLLP